MLKSKSLPLAETVTEPSVDSTVCNSLVASVSSSVVIWSAIAVWLAVIAEFCVICSASKLLMLAVLVATSALSSNDDRSAVIVPPASVNSKFVPLRFKPVLSSLVLSESASLKEIVVSNPDSSV